MMDKQELISVFKTNIAEEEQDKEGRQLPTDSWLNGYENGRIDALEFGYKLAKWLDEPEKPEIPKFVADWIRGFRILDVTDLDIIGLYFSKEIEKKCEQWITDNFNDFIKALVNGYTEKAPVWVVLKGAQYFHAFTGEYDKFEGFEYVLSMYEGNAHTFTDKQKAEAVATLVDGTVKKWSE